MGNTENRPQAPPVDKIRFEMICQNTFLHLQLQRDRKIAELQKREKELRELVVHNKDNANKENISMETSNCINQLNYIQGANIVLNNIKMLKENSLDIVNYLNRKQSLNIGQLDPFVQSVVWSTSRLNLNQVREFSDFLSMYLGANIYQLAEVSPNVDLKLKKLFMNVSASPMEIHDYLEKFCKRNELSLDLIKDMWTTPTYVTPTNNHAAFGQFATPHSGLPGFPPSPSQPQGAFFQQPYQPNPGFQSNPVMAPAPASNPLPQPPQQPSSGLNFGGATTSVQLNPFNGYGNDQPKVSETSNPFSGSKGNISDINFRISELRRIGA